MSIRIRTKAIVALAPLAMGFAACGVAEPSDEASPVSDSLVERGAEAAQIDAYTDGRLSGRRDAFDEAWERERRALLTRDEGVWNLGPAHGALTPRNACDGLHPGTGDYCSTSCLCEDGEGDCDSNDECESGTYCKPDVGGSYGFNPIVDVCVAYPGCHTTVPGRGDFCTSLCKCNDGEGDCDSNDECATGTYCKPDVGGSYGYAASVDVCVAYPGCHTTLPGKGAYCSVSCQCAAGEGDCDSNDECTSGLVCRPDVGAYYGYAAVVDVCQDPLDTCSGDGDCTGDWWCLDTACVYGNTIGIDGSLDFDTTNERFDTVTESYDVYFAWDENNLYVAMTGDSINGNDPTHFVLIYLDGVAAHYTTTGMAHGSQQPGLPFGAGYHIAWQANNASTVAYVFDGNNWVNAGWDFTGDVYQSGTTVEFRIPLGSTDGINLGALPADVSVHVSMIDADNHWTWAGCPADSYAQNPAGSGGANDPDYGKYYSFTIGGTAVPKLYSSQ